MKASRTFPGSGLAMPSAARAVQRILGLAPPLEHERAAVIIRDAILAIGVLGIALFTRFWMLGGTGVSGDEAVYSAQAAVIGSDTRAVGGPARSHAAFGFFIALSMLFAATWTRSQHSQNLWLYAFAAAAALAIQVKVTGVLVVVIAALDLVASGQIRKIRLRQWVGGGAVFVLFMAPALIEFAIDPHQFLALLGDSTRRLSNVPSGYYFRKLSSYEGFI